MVSINSNWHIEIIHHYKAKSSILSYQQFQHNQNRIVHWHHNSDINNAQRNTVPTNIYFLMYRKHKEQWIQWVPDTVSFPELVQRCFILSNHLAGKKTRLLELRYTLGLPFYAGLCVSQYRRLNTMVRRLLSSISWPSFEPHNVDRQESM